MSAAFEHHWMIPEPLRSHVGGAEQVINQLAKSVLVKPSPVVVSWAVVLLDNPAISAGKLAEIVSLDPVLSCKAFSFAQCANLCYDQRLAFD
jgi:hypothetical protein